MIPDNYMQQLSGSIEGMQAEQKGQRGGMAATSNLKKILKEVGEWAKEETSVDGILQRVQASKSYSKLKPDLQDRLSLAITQGKGKPDRPPAPDRKPMAPQPAPRSNKPERSPRKESSQQAKIRKTEWKRADPQDRPPSMEAPPRPDRKK